MPASLQKQAEQAAIRRKIADDRVAEARSRYVLKAFQNDNLKQSRKRKMGWQSPAGPERDFCNSDRRKALAMARQRIEENPIYFALNKARLDHIVGGGFRLQMRSGDKAWDKEVEAAWLQVRDKIDIRGMRSWARLQRCLQARHDIDGDVGGILVAEDKNEWLQIIEGDRIGRVKQVGQPEDDGIIFDKYGMPIRFYVLDKPDAPTSEKPWDRQDFIFYACDGTERASRRRGVTAYLQTFNIGADHAEILDAMVQKVKNAAMFALQFNLKSPQPFGEAEATTAGENGVDYRTVKHVPGTNVVLGVDESASVIESKTPDAQFLPFEKVLITRMSFPVNMTYELVTGDFAAMNYTTSRAMFEIVKKGVRCEQYDLGAISSRIFQWKLSRMVKRGDLKPPASIEKTWWNHKWGVPGFPYMNPMQEATADALRIERGLASRQGIIAERGDDDFDDIADELQYENDGLIERGLPVPVTPGSVPTQAQNDSATQNAS